MKAFTDISQSKKLAEILSLESADMCYLSEESLVPKVIYNGMVFFNSKEERLTNVIHCWSLAALLGVLPKNLNIGRPSLDSNYKGYYWIQYYDEFMKPNNYKTECYDNPVDACYEMIIKLHEQKLL